MARHSFLQHSLANVTLESSISWESGGFSQVTESFSDGVEVEVCAVVGVIGTAVAMSASSSNDREHTSILVANCIIFQIVTKSERSFTPISRKSSFNNRLQLNPLSVFDQLNCSTISREAGIQRNYSY